ncbi:hypothetical protein MRX96_002839 [Rhipicephalus microplus]
MTCTFKLSSPYVGNNGGSGESTTLHPTAADAATYIMDGGGTAQSLVARQPPPRLLANSIWTPATTRWPARSPGARATHALAQITNESSERGSRPQRQRRRRHELIERASWQPPRMGDAEKQERLRILVSCTYNVYTARKFTIAHAW